MAGLYLNHTNTLVCPIIKRKKDKYPNLPWLLSIWSAFLNKRWSLTTRCISSSSVSIFCSVRDLVCISTMCRKSNPCSNRNHLKERGNWGVSQQWSSCISYCIKTCLLRGLQLCSITSSRLHRTTSFDLLSEAIGLQMLQLSFRQDV